MQVNELVTLISAVSDSGMKHFSYQTDLESIVISNREGEISNCGTEMAVLREKSGHVLQSMKEEQPYTQSHMAAMTAEVTAAPQEPGDTSLFCVTAPNVGTVLLNDVKTGEPVVTVGDTVKKGQLLFIIESMKLFIDVAAPVSGKIAQVCVYSQQAVEFGTVIMKIEMEK